MRYRPSRGFVGALFGVAMTLFAWYGPWAWPATPAFTVMQLAFGGGGNFAELSYNARSVWMVVLIVSNVSAWGVIMVAAAALLARLRTSADRGV